MFKLIYTMLKNWNVGHGGGITSGMSYIEVTVGQSEWAMWLGGQSELGAALLHKAV